ncbi:MAG: RES family NAD+ phosphorylase [Xenococcus sp. MO_188.B8]|nr:RES family NAD+ phosphorylase [Xenococcus sp. MO_188.B8]
MVEIRYPPPTRNITPQLFELKPGTTIQRIFDPTSYGATATGFRYYGPLSRFDHQRGTKAEIDSKRGIIYAGFSLSCCLIEVFGDHGIIKLQQQQIAYITLKQSIKLLNLRDSGAWDAGATSSMVVDGRRKLTQAWSRYFYGNSDLYGEIDGLIFNNAHNGEEAICLYERAVKQLSSASISTLNLNEPTMRESILKVANQLNLLVEIES